MATPLLEQKYNCKGPSEPNSPLCYRHIYHYQIVFNVLYYNYESMAWSTKVIKGISKQVQMNDSQTHTELSFVRARTFLIFIFHNDLYYSATCDVHGAVLAK